MAHSRSWTLRLEPPPPWNLPDAKGTLFIKL